MPFTYTPEQREKAKIAVIEGLRQGTPLTVICSADGMPCDDTVRDWGEQDPEFGRAIARARETGFDTIALSCLAIVDDTEEDPASRRVRAETRLKLLAKWDPKRYGELIKHGNADGSNIDMAAAIAAGNARLNDNAG